ncbi:Lar family restriction alleviation protein, partial [Burkholderia multivorans]|uniref:Lar family restriction alleviation protein n=1 Tax=Burkholderia multivorans TaxID=87883 RepID=UPI001C21A03A
MTTDKSSADALRDLLPCPHCGHAAQIVTGDGPFFGRVQVECRSCRIATFWYDEAVAVRQWNRRVAASPSSQPAAAPIDIEARFVAEHGHRLAKLLRIDAFDIADRDAQIMAALKNEHTPAPADEQSEAAPVDTLIARPDPLNREPSEYASDMLKRAAADSIREENAPAPADERAAFEQLKDWPKMAPREVFYAGWRAARAAAHAPADERAVPNTITIRVDKDRFDRLMDALDRAESKGYLPDAMADEWNAFEWEVVPTSRASSANETGAEGADELSPEFTDSARAALLWVLYHHQGGSSPVGQPIRFALGMGAHEALKPSQVAAALRIAKKCHWPYARELPTAPAQAAEPVAWMVLAANTRQPCEVTLYKSETEALRQDCVVPL